MSDTLLYSGLERHLVAENINTVLYSGFERHLVAENMKHLSSGLDNVKQIIEVIIDMKE